MSKKRTSPAELVKLSIAGSRNWLLALSEENRAYIHEVVDIIHDTPGVRLYNVADKLIEELGIHRSRGTVYQTIKEILNAKA